MKSNPMRRDLRGARADPQRQEALPPVDSRAPPASPGPPLGAQLAAPDDVAPDQPASDQVAPDQTAPRCPECDYILLGLPSNRCPECGRPFEWAAVIAEARAPLLPIDRAAGWRRLIGAAQTWLLVLFRPRTFARRLSERCSIRAATLFALACMVLGLTGNAVFGFDRFRWDEQAFVAWPIAVWFHIECQSFLFFLLDMRRRHWLRRWSFWRKLSLYTTAFVVLDWAAGPPVLESYGHGGNFPWLLRPDSWQLSNWRELARGAAYYWWMAVLLTALWTRMRWKWSLLIILALLPAITMASCRFAYEVTARMGYH